MLGFGGTRQQSRLQVLRAKLQVAGNLGRGDVVEDEARGAQERAEILQGDLRSSRSTAAASRRTGGFQGCSSGNGSGRSAAMTHLAGTSELTTQVHNA